MPNLIECVGIKRAHVSIFLKWCFMAEHFFKCRPIHLCKNSTYSVQVQLVRFRDCFANCSTRSHVTDLCRFHNYSCIFVVESCTNNAEQKPQDLPLPHIPVQESFYFRQLWIDLYVFGTNNLKIKSHIFIYIMTGEQPTKYVPYCCIISLATYLKLSKYCIFLGCCPGQNRNHTVVIFLATLVANVRFNKIFQYFSVR
jgi:hypothetical protein